MKVTQIGSIPNLTHNVECMVPQLYRFVRETGKKTVKPEHIILVLSNQDHGFGGAILRDHLREIGVKPAELMGKLFGANIAARTFSQEITFGAYAAKVFEDAKSFTDGSIGSGELLLALAKRFGNTGKIKELNLNADKIEREIKERSRQFPSWKRV